MGNDPSEARDAYRRRAATVRDQRWAIAILMASLVAAGAFLVTGTAWALAAVMVVGIIVAGVIHWRMLRRAPMNTPFDHID